MDRRAFLSSTAAALAGAMLPSTALAQVSAGDAALNALFDAIFQDLLARSPELTTALGLDKGARAAAKHKLDDESLAEEARDVARTHAWIARLEAVPESGLSRAAALNREIILYSMRSGISAWDRFQIGSAQRPYRISQLSGVYYGVPDFLNGSHTIATAEDCEAYLDRLAAFPTNLDQDTEAQRTQAARGYLAPDFSLDLALGQMTKLRAPAAADTSMVRSIATRAAAKRIPGDWSVRAATIVQQKVFPALDRQIALVKQLRAGASPIAGAWRLPHGDEIYAAALQQATTTTLSPAEVHKMGVDQVAAITGQLDTILKAQGLTKGSVGERLTALNDDPRQLYPDTDQGRLDLIESLNASIRDMRARLPQAFADLPKTPLEIRRVPIEIQDGAPNGYYQRGALDGSRPALYFINLKEMRDWPKFSLPTLTYHEGIPGHHLQISIAQESADIPVVRKATGFFSAYTEGWALYAEQLATELGAYDRDPIGRAGFLQSFLFRAARLVVDTGLHSLKWTREQATDYLVATTGYARPRCQREVERYCVMIGQACSYKVGHMAWVAARARAQAALGPKFDIKEFHKVLRDGAMPLTILDRVVDARTAALRSA